jgi:hypothetical protein
MSEYLGLKDHQPSRSEFDPNRVDRNVMPGGAMTQSYENYVKVRKLDQNQNNLKLREFCSKYMLK